MKQLVLHFIVWRENGFTDLKVKFPDRSSIMKPPQSAYFCSEEKHKHKVRLLIHQRVKIEDQQKNQKRFS